MKTRSTKAKVIKRDESKLYACKKCGERFSGWNPLMVHYRSAHKKRGPYKKKTRKVPQVRTTKLPIPVTSPIPTYNHNIFFPTTLHCCPNCGMNLNAIKVALAAVEDAMQSNPTGR